MQTNQQEILKTLNLSLYPSPKGWYVGKCPFCGRENKFGIKFDTQYEGKSVSSFNCFSAKCNQKGGLFYLLKHINRLDLLTKNYSLIQEKSFLTNKFIIESNELDYSLKEKQLPLGFKRVFSDKYLVFDRNFPGYIFERYEIGKTQLDPNWRNRIIFVIRIDNKVVGYVGRSTYSKEWHKQNELDFKQKLTSLYFLRYKNSADTEFEKILYGVDDIKTETKIILIVEGITDKINTDVKLKLHTQKHLKCCASLGKNITKYHVELLKSRGIEDIILLHDPDAIESTKKNAFFLEKYFNVLIGYIKDETKDPGCLDEKDFNEIFSTLETPEEFYINKLAKKGLKI
jgi:hypothetical protein